MSTTNESDSGPRRRWGRLGAVLSYVLPLALVAPVTVVGVDQVLASGWQEQRETFVIDANRDPARGPGASDDVIVLGDSITEGADRALRDSLSNEFRLRIRGRGGYRVEDMEPYAIESATSDPEQVIINLGTNDVIKNWPIERSLQAMERILDHYRGVRCVHVVTINELMYEPPEDQFVRLRAVLFNLTLHRFAAAKRISLIDWAKLLHDEADQGYPRGELTSDSIHPNSFGRQRLVQMYKDALRSC